METKTGLKKMPKCVRDEKKDSEMVVGDGVRMETKDGLAVTVKMLERPQVKKVGQKDAKREIGR